MKKLNYRCRKCGGTLVPNADQVTALCEFCGCIQPIPVVDAACYNRANELRREKKFAQAAVLLEGALSIDPKDAEGNWNMVLCKFGIEYVEEPDGSRKPTCHGISYCSVLEDPHYLCALKYADSESAKLYKEEAAQIYKIQQEVIELAQTGEKYDIFISYKETNAEGNRTIDSVIAQELYEHLNGMGYRVFFARVALAEKGGLSYEPVIFSALNSASVMIVVGSSRENLTSLWVRNEWERYLFLMQENSDKKMLLVYRNMKQSEFPEKLEFMSCVDAGNYGYLQQAETFAAAALPGKTAVVVGDMRAQTAEALARANNLFQRAEQELKRGHHEKAKQYYQAALELDETRSEAWWELFLLDVAEQEAASADSPDMRGKVLREGIYAIGYAEDEKKGIYEEQLHAYRQKERKKFEQKLLAEIQMKKKKSRTEQDRQTVTALESLLQEYRRIWQREN